MTAPRPEIAARRSRPQSAVCPLLPPLRDGQFDGTLLIPFQPELDQVDDAASGTACAQDEHQFRQCALLLGNRLARSSVTSPATASAGHGGPSASTGRRPRLRPRLAHRTAGQPAAGGGNRRGGHGPAAAGAAAGSRGQQSRPWQRTVRARRGDRDAELRSPPHVAGPPWPPPMDSFRSPSSAAHLSFPETGVFPCEPPSGHPESHGADKYPAGGYRSSSTPLATPAESPRRSIVGFHDPGHLRAGSPPSGPTASVLAGQQRGSTSTTSRPRTCWCRTPRRSWASSRA